MNRTFKIILSLTLLHDYYTGGYSPDFVITPTTDTKRLLKSNRWLYGNTAHGFFIGCDNLAMDMFSAVLVQKPVRLRFILRLKNPDFPNFTTLPSRSGSKDIYYLHSQEGSQELAMETVALCPPVFTYQFPVSGDDSTNLQVKDPDGTVRIDKTLQSSADQQLSVSVNLEGHTPGLYRFMVSDQPDQNIYITDEAPGNGVFGLTEITLPEDFNPEVSGKYQFQFNAKSSVWEYHLLFSKNYEEGHSFTINDTEGGVVFTEINAPPNYNKGSLSTFVSQTPIPYREATKKGLQLIISPPGEDTDSTFDHLPNPSANNPEPKVHLTV